MSTSTSKQRPRRKFTCPPDHPHGAKSTCYSEHHCGCDDCRAWRVREFHKYESRRRSATVQQFRPATDVVGHLSLLVGDGWRYADIEAVSGVTKPTIVRIMRGHTKRVTVETADAILGTVPEMRDRKKPSRFVPATGTTRRVQALARMGWTYQIIALRSGKTPEQISGFVHQDRVTVETHETIAALYAELWSQTPPQGTRQERTSSLRMKLHAERMGWPSPLDWEDIDQDEAPELGHVIVRCRVGHLIDGPNSQIPAYRAARAGEKADKWKGEHVCAACSETQRKFRGTGADHRIVVQWRENRYRELMPHDNPEVEDVDDELVDRALRGERVRLNYREKRSFVRRGHARRWSDELMAGLLRVDSKVVGRIREELDLPAVPVEEYVHTESRATRAA